MSPNHDLYTSTHATPADLSSGPCEGRWRLCLTTGRLTPVPKDEPWDFMQQMAEARHRYALDPADIVYDPDQLFDAAGNPLSFTEMQHLRSLTQNAA